MRSLLALLVLLTVRWTAISQAPSERNAFPIPHIPFSPRQYVCYRTPDPIRVDGVMDEESWKSAAWTDAFVDIEGEAKPAPLYKTRVKMLWDDQYFYVGAEIQEPNLWATLRQRDTVIFRDNDFEVFIDPNGATQPYYETEINALGTVWDLLLRAPYRDVDKAAINAWDIKGLNLAVSLHGTLNNPSDVDSGWTVEIAFPWAPLGEGALAGAPPKDGAQWRINFSRVEWRIRGEHGVYIKENDPRTGRPYPEYNWVWSPQGLINMHYPEMWGFVQFSGKAVGTGEERFVWNPVESVKWNLRLVYYAERQYFNEHSVFTADLTRLRLKLLPVDGYEATPTIYVAPDMFEAIIARQDGQQRIRIDQDGRTVISPSN